LTLAFMLARLADKFVLCPSRDPLPAENKQRQALPLGDGQLEVLTMHAGAGEPQAFVLKFGGTGSRAERADLHPAEVWPQLQAEVWAVNYPGYGGSSGRASMPGLVAAANTAYEHLARQAQGRPIFVTGNSIGTTCALYLAARVPVAGLLLRNPPPLKQLIVGHHGWWNLGLGAKLIARQVPSDLCSLDNAAQAKAPAVFLSAGRDRVVPPPYQQQIFERYAGPKQVVIDPEADHATLLDAAIEPNYRAALDWLARQALPQAANHAETS
jgi:pimeloyl-ACP methyl ester carboxylesterase